MSLRILRRDRHESRRLVGARRPEAEFLQRRRPDQGHRFGTGNDVVVDEVAAFEQEFGRAAARHGGDL